MGNVNFIWTLLVVDMLVFKGKRGQNLPLHWNGAQWVLISVNLQQ